MEFPSDLEALDYGDLQRVLKLARRMELPEGDRERLVSALGASGDKTLARDIERSLLLSESRRVSDPLWPTSTDDRGSIHLGKSGKAQASLTTEELNRNLLVVGETGSGKTNLFYHLIRQFIEQDLPIMAFDFKQDYRHLTRLEDELIVLRWEELKFNPLRPPEGVSPLRWLQVFANTFSDSQGFLTASKYFLMSRVHRLYKLYGIFEGEDRYPSFHELAEVLRYEKQPLVTKQARYLETTINRVEAISLAVGDILDCSQGLPMGKLLKQNVIIELDGLAKEIQQFLVEAILVWIYFYRMAKGHRGELRHCIIFDEAKKVFDANKERNYESGVPIIDDITAKTREFGEALIVGDQELAKLTDSIKANTYSVLGLPLGSGKDIEELSEVMGLTSRQEERLYRLEVGEGVFKKSGEGPTRVSTPLVEIDKGVTTEEAKKANEEAKRAFQVEVRDRYRPKCFENYLQDLAGKHKVKDKSIKTGEPEKEEKISEEAEELLIEVAENPFRKLSDRYQDLSLSSYKGNKLKKKLLDKGYVKEVELSLGAGGRPKFLQLTEKGETLFEDIKPGEVHTVKGGGSFVHKFWQNKIAGHFQEKGYETFIEFVVDESQLDVLAVSAGGGERIGVEVALSPGGEVDNIKKGLEADLDRLIVACKNERVMSQVGKRARQKVGEGVSEVRFCPVTDFL